MLQNSTFLLLSSQVLLSAVIAGVVGLAVGSVIVYIFLNVGRNSKIAQTKKQIENLMYRAKLSLRSELEKGGFVYEDF